MQKLMTAAALAAAALLIAPQALACEGHEDGKKADRTAQATPAAAAAPAAPIDQVQQLTVAQLAEQMKAAQQKKARLAIFDVNSVETRTAQGVIPTAVLLSGSKSYDVAALPKDKADAVVFYCSNTQCGASKKAAVRAIEAGHINVSVLPEGIAGWVKAGQSVQKPVS